MSCATDQTDKKTVSCLFPPSVNVSTTIIIFTTNTTTTTTTTTYFYLVY